MGKAFDLLLDGHPWNTPALSQSTYFHPSNRSSPVNDDHSLALSILALSYRFNLSSGYILPLVFTNITTIVHIRIHFIRYTFGLGVSLL